MVQKWVERGLALHHSVEYATSVLPLKNGVRRAAAALETACLPYRLRKTHAPSHHQQPLIGLNSYYHGSYDSSLPFGSASHSEFREFVGSLQSQSSTRLRCIWELDATSTTSSNKGRWSRLSQGTALEQDQRMRQGNHRPQTIMPGSWLLDENNVEKGLLTSYSPTVAAKSGRNSTDRSLHHHFA
jgi:hypothetical protein